MPRFLLLPPLALLAACIASASAEELEHDVITLNSGERLVGELVDVRDGRYWMLLTDGRMVSAEFRSATRVEMAGASVQPIAISDLPLPDWDNYDGPADTKRPIAGGFDFGLNQAARIRFRTNSPAVAHIDLKAGGSLVFGSGVGPALLTGVDVAFFHDAPVHLTLSAVLGPAIIWGSLYPFVGAGTGLQIDPKGPVEVHIGLTAGTTFSYFAVSPDLSLSWVW
ncbi:MAG: hypothetical protein Q8P41_29420 [Pseudomonadota bacterium]|nr:hypothetical protein [Pseudomonadota bacterium]